MDCKELERIQEEFKAINDKYRKVSHIDEHIEMMGQVEKLLLALKEFDIAS